ncbi:E3 ubiquitin-protein ligase ARIH1 [Araneus ventricosus]|uniref:RBR-type E3 ubiquitin transferase n=1 Tax=Araneus ventricosus TaxID=182803 RepID=A0A4Y2HFV6_ARAVE|nr:E3 ubiquitin-protein ligase ARIH1 [Araneus ventricosus]
MDSDGEICYDSDSKTDANADDECFCWDSEFFSNSDKLESDDDYPYTVLSTADVVDVMLKLIKEVNNIVEIPPTITRILLNHFNWDTEKLYERYYDGDPDNLFKAAHVVNPITALSRSKVKSANKNNEFCEICFRKIPFSLMTSLACGHRYCTECWTIYITTKIMDQGEVQSIPCFAVGCDILVDDQTIMNLLVDPKVKLKYQYLITNNFIVCNRLLRHCPQPGCSYVIRVQYVEARPVTCACGHTFCFKCSENWHDPITCHLLKKWEKKCHDDSATLNWIAANTKKCPFCNVRIEKDGGCNHMVCKNQNCKFEFCWLCLRAWNSHEFQWDACNRYNEEISKTKEQSKSALDKYLFYYDRYMNHVKSLKFENKLYATVKRKMEEMQQINISWNETQFLKKAVDILCECRQTLMYTYVFAYYLSKTNESAIFETNQHDLQNAVEQLSEYLERDITVDNVFSLKQTVQDKSRYCDNRRRVLLSHVYEGYEKDFWKYVES